LSNDTASETPASSHDTVLVVDFGAQYAQLIARRVRELSVYSEIVPHRISAAQVGEKAPSAIILSGGPASVNIDGTPRLDPDIYELGIPIFGICYGAQLIAAQLGGTVGRGLAGEYGRARVTRTAESSLVPDEVPDEYDVWMSHFDAITVVPPGFTPTGRSKDAPVAVLVEGTRRSWGGQ
jgi:GMP synthase (glutamine-hydrolysing)